MWYDHSRYARTSMRAGLCLVNFRSALRTNDGLDSFVVQKQAGSWGTAHARSFACKGQGQSSNLHLQVMHNGCVYRLDCKSKSWWSNGRQNRRRALSSYIKLKHKEVKSFTSDSVKHQNTGSDTAREDFCNAAEDVDHAALLRRMAKYIEEDTTVADELAAVMSTMTGNKLNSALDGMAYTVRQPSFKELRKVALVSTIPYIGFGFMDNAIMVVAGEYIDITVGVALGFSTMAAAALGNTISDVAGVGLGGALEVLGTRLGLPAPRLSRAQMRLRRTRLASLVGNAIGVAIGCLLGMFPLLFMSDPDAVEAVKRKEKIAGLIDAVVEEAASFLSATSATLFILERDSDVLWARRRGLPGAPDANGMHDLKLDLADSGPVSRAAQSGEAVIIPPASGSDSPSTLCMPVFEADGSVAGVVQVLKKRKDGMAHQVGFSEEDAKNLSALCSHISVALENIKRADQQDEVNLRETISLMRSYGGANRIRPFPQHRATGSPPKATV